MNATVSPAPDLREGAEIDPTTAIPTAVQLFRFSAATGNPHLIHYNTDHAHDEGYPGLVVQSHLHASLLVQAARRWAGPAARMRRFRWENRHLAVVGDELTITGRVTRVDADPHRYTVDLELAEHNQHGQLCAPAWATVTIDR